MVSRPDVRSSVPASGVPASGVPASGARSLLRALWLAAGIALEGRPGAGWLAALLALLLLELRPSTALPPVPPHPATRELRARLLLAGVFLLLGRGAALLVAATDPVPGLLETWRRHGFQPGVTPVRLWGRLLDAEVLPEGRAAIVLRLDRFALPGRPGAEGAPARPVRVRLTLPAPVDPPTAPWRAGDHVELMARLGRPRDFLNPGAFDYAAHLRIRGIGLTGTIKSSRLIDPYPAPGAWFLSVLPSLRREIVERLRRACSPDAATASFLAAILVGEREDLAPEFERALRRAGVYHVIALSGLNVGLAALMITALLRLAGVPTGVRRAIEMLGVALYWAVARPGGSIHRAALMGLIYLAGGIVGRRVTGLGAAGAALLLILLWGPEWWRDAGFQLSVAATLAILLLLPAVRPASRGREAPGWRWIAELLILEPLRVSGAALAGTALIGARHFHAMSPAALPANLFAVPLAGMLLILGPAIALLETPVPRAAKALASLAAGLVRGLHGLAAAVAALPGASIFVLPPAPELVVCAGAAVAVIGFWARPLQRRAGALVLALAILVALGRGRAPRPARDFQVISLDVGQGDATLLRLPGGPTLLVDAGGFARSRFDVGERVLAPAVRALGLLQIDVLAITHAHRDHLGGAAAVLDQLRPGALWMGRMPEGAPAVAALEELAAARGIPVVRPRRGVRLLAGGCRIEVLNPGPGVRAAGVAANDDSLVLRITCGQRSALLTGDLEAPLEAILLSEGRELRAELLKVGHHGSGTSTSAPFLSAIAPRHAVISVGANNPWGLPDQGVLERLAAAGVRVYRTDRDGAVLFRTDGRGEWTATSLRGGPVR